MNAEKISLVNSKIKIQSKRSRFFFDSGSQIPDAVFCAKKSVFICVHLRPIILNFVAEGVGFEPTSPFGETVFKTAAIDHSAIPP
jgi:hypothetical protein